MSFFSKMLFSHLRTRVSVMSSYEKDNKTNYRPTNLSIGEPRFYLEVESLIQSLKNNQRCYAEAASLVNSSELRNFFEKIELERTIFMEKIAKAIGRLDLITGVSGHGADVVWFASIEVNGKSMTEFDRAILSRCTSCEEGIHQAYISTLGTKPMKLQFGFLDSQYVRLQTVRTELSQFVEKYSRNRK